MSSMDAAKGTKLHALAAELINTKIKLPDTQQTINAYVNDAIGFRMEPEVLLYYSDNCFGTADAVSFRDNILRIHDLKNGVSPAKMDQLLIYAAIFCLEYNFRPNAIQIVLRIYQNDTYEEHSPELDEMIYVMDRIKSSDELIDRWKAELLR